MRLCTVGMMQPQFHEGRDEERATLVDSSPFRECFLCDSVGRLGKLEGRCDILVARSDAKRLACNWSSRGLQLVLWEENSAINLA